MTERNHSIQVGDIFVRNDYFDGDSSYSFFQVVKLKGKTQVVIVPLEQEMYIDEHCKPYDEVLLRPVPLTDCSSESEGIIIRRIWTSDERTYLDFPNTRWQSAHSYDENERYVLSGNGIGIRAQYFWERLQGKAE